MYLESSYKMPFMWSYILKVTVSDGEVYQIGIPSKVGNGSPYSVSST